MRFRGAGMHQRDRAVVGSGVQHVAPTVNKILCVDEGLASGRELSSKMVSDMGHVPGAQAVAHSVHRVEVEGATIQNEGKHHLKDTQSDMSELLSMMRSLMNTLKTNESQQLSDVSHTMHQESVNQGSEIVSSVPVGDGDHRHQV